MNHQLVPQFILENYAQGKTGGRFSAVSLFADISGFSTVTYALMEHGSEAAEAMANVMWALFEPLVQQIYAHCGFITGFAGDAFTALFPKHRFDAEPAAYTHALAAARRIQEHVAAHPSQHTPYGSFPFGIKLGLADGEVVWGILQPDAESMDQAEVKAVHFFSGPAIEAAAAAEHQAAAGELILSAAVHRVVAPLGQAEPIPATGHFRVTAVPGALPKPRPVERAQSHLEYMADFLPRAIRAETGKAAGAEVWGEFRQVLTLFLQLEAISSSRPLERFVQAVLSLQQQYGGYLNRIDFGDKGCNLLLFWGAPTSFENDVARLLNFILALRRATPFVFKAGITYQPMYAGLTGSPTRGEFSCYGRGVTLAARFMTTAPWDEIWLDENTAQRAGPHFAIEPIGLHTFKGFPQAYPVYLLRGYKDPGEEEFFRGAMVGRQAELDQLAQFVQPIFQGRFAGVMLISGEAGLGKSRLVHEFQARLAQAHPHSQFFLCQSDQILRQSLNPFRYWLHNYFGVHPAQSPALNQRGFQQKIDRLIADTKNPTLQNELERTRSFLGALVNLSWEGSLYEQVDPKGRFENTRIALKTLIKAESQHRPLLILLEDIQWLDQDSIQFVQELVRNVESYPFGLVVTTRPASGRDRPEQSWMEQEIVPQKIELSSLSGQELGDLAQERLGGALAAGLGELLVQRAEGNPFFAEQILLYLQEQGQIERRGEHWHLLAPQDQAIPTDVRAVLIARLDRLSQEIKGIVQTAAVLGREFEVLVLAEMLQHPQGLADSAGPMKQLPEGLWEQIKKAEREAIWVALSQLHYLFKHALLRDTAYGMLLRARRRELHQLAAQALETLYAEELAQHYGQIAYHYKAAYQQGLEALRGPARDYLQRAGCLAAEHYETEAAIDALSQAEALTLESEAETRYELLLAREGMYQLRGRREEQAQDLATLAQLAERLRSPAKKAAVALRQAAYARNTSAFDLAIDSAQAAIAFAREVTDPSEPAEGTRSEISGQIIWGETLLWQGEHLAAQEHLTRALEMARSIGDAPREGEALRGLGILHFHRSDFSRAKAYIQQELDIFRQAQDRRREGDALNTLGIISGAMGDYAQASLYFEQVRAIFQKIGDRAGEGKVSGNMGIVANHLGEYDLSLEHYQRALDIHQEIGDRMGVGTALVNLGQTYYNLGEYVQAEAVHRQVLTINQETGDRTGEVTTRTNLGLVLTRLGQYEQAAEHFQEAWAGRQEQQDPLGSGSILNHLGHLAYIQGRLEQARSYYEQALASRRELGQPTCIAEDLSGLARVDLAQGRVEQALAKVEEILPILEGDPNLSGAVHPGLVLLACYQVLQADRDPRADAILTEARTLLRQRAAKIADPALRRSFLENISEHRQLLKG
ncbi:MAG: tetratricopeptide repeat protein [Chloroflexia bacterium]|nr:tetratricopeptide repeat protein [Chloroflexia bacterium]